MGPKQAKRHCVLLIRRLMLCCRHACITYRSVRRDHVPSTGACHKGIRAFQAHLQFNVLSIDFTELGRCALINVRAVPVCSHSSSSEWLLLRYVLTLAHQHLQKPIIGTKMLTRLIRAQTLMSRLPEREPVCV